MLGYLCTSVSVTAQPLASASRQLGGQSQAEVRCAEWLSNKVLKNDKKPEPMSKCFPGGLLKVPGGYDLA